MQSMARGRHVFGAALLAFPFASAAFGMDLDTGLAELDIAQRSKAATWATDECQPGWQSTTATCFLEAMPDFESRSLEKSRLIERHLKKLPAVEAGTLLGTWRGEDIEFRISSDGSNFLLQAGAAQQGVLRPRGRWYIADLEDAGTVVGRVRLRSVRDGLKSQFKARGEEAFGLTFVARPAPVASGRPEQLSQVPADATFSIPLLDRPPPADFGEARWREAARDHLHASGVLRVRSVVPLQDCRRVLRHIMSSVAQEGRTEIVVEPKHRHHVLLDPMDRPLSAAIQQMVEVLGTALESALGGDARLFEFAAFLTNPGAEAQSLHQDVHGEEGHARSYSVFLLLTDVDSEKDGPLTVVPRSNYLSQIGDRLHNRFKMIQAKQQGIVVAKEDDHWPDVDAHDLEVPVLAQAGDVIIYDRSLFHRGSANSGDRTRGVFYMTFIGIGEVLLDQKPAILNEMLHPPRGPLTIHELVDRTTSASDSTRIHAANGTASEL